MCTNPCTSPSTCYYECPAYGSVYFVCWSRRGHSCPPTSIGKWPFFFQNNMSFSRAIFPPKVWLFFFWVIPCFHIAKGDIRAPLVSSRGRSHTIPCHMMISYDTAAICQSMLVENDVRMVGRFSGNKELSKTYREGKAQKLKSMALPYKTKVRKKCPKFWLLGFLIA